MVCSFLNSDAHHVVYTSFPESVYIIYIVPPALLVTTVLSATDVGDELLDLLHPKPKTINHKLSTLELPASLLTSAMSCWICQSLKGDSSSAASVIIRK